jgi:hypothetical protein
MFGILAVEMIRSDQPVLCTQHIVTEDGYRFDPIVYPSREVATIEAASLTEWYQRDIRPDVVYAAVPLPMY